MPARYCTGRVCRKVLAERSTSADPVRGAQRLPDVARPHERIVGETLADGLGHQGGASPRFTVTLFFCVKLSSMPSRENSRPIPLCFTPP